MSTFVLPGRKLNPPKSQDNEDWYMVRNDTKDPQVKTLSRSGSPNGSLSTVNSDSTRDSGFSGSLSTYSKGEFNYFYIFAHCSCTNTNIIGQYMSVRTHTL